MDREDAWLLRRETTTGGDPATQSGAFRYSGQLTEQVIRGVSATTVPPSDDYILACYAPTSDGSEDASEAFFAQVPLVCQILAIMFLVIAMVKYVLNRATSTAERAQDEENQVGEGQGQVPSVPMLMPAAAVMSFSLPPVPEPPAQNAADSVVNDAILAPAVLSQEDEAPDAIADEAHQQHRRGSPRHRSRSRTTIHRADDHGTLDTRPERVEKRGRPGSGEPGHSNRTSGIRRGGRQCATSAVVW